MPVRSIKDRFLYKESNGDKIMSAYISKAAIATPDQLQYPLGVIERYFKFPLKVKVIQAFKNGTLKLYYSPPAYANKIPVSLPFRLFQERGAIKAAVFFDNHVKLNTKDKSLEIDPKKLYCYMEGAYVAIMFQNSFKVLCHDAAILTELCSIYAHMITRVFVKRFALNVQQKAQDKVLFLAAKFFMISLLGLNNDSQTFNYALKISSNLTPPIVRELDDTIETDKYEGIDKFIDALAQFNYLINPALSGYSVRAFVEDFVNMYGSIALYAIEDVEYLLFNVLAAMNGGFLNKQFAFDAIINNNSNKIYNAIEKVSY